MLIPTDFLARFFVLREVQTLPKSRSPLSVPGTGRAQRLGLNSHVLHGRLPATAASADPVTSASTSLQQQGNRFLPSLPRVPLKLKGRRNYPHWLWFGAMLNCTKGGGGRAGGELIPREPAAPLMSAHNSVAGSDTGAGAPEETELSN